MMTPSQTIKYFIWDIETFPNCFLFSGKWRGSGNTPFVFEISDRKNDKSQLIQFLNYLRDSDALMVGFNNLGFDYPIVNELLQSPYTFDALKAYQLCTQIIGNGDRSNQLNYLVPFDKRHVRQLDLYKMNHFDNPNKRTSLKALQCAMRSDSIEDLPFPVGKLLTSAQMDALISYNIHDITETEKFLDICQPAIDMRLELIDTAMVPGDVLNFSDVKIGEQYLVKKIGRNKCYAGSKPRQTIRNEIQFKNITLPKIKFETDVCNEVLDWFNSIVVYPTKKERETFKKVVTIGDIEFHFGLGGVHASVESKAFHSDNEFIIKDIDVGGMYPAVMIANSVAPEHLGHDFSLAYAQLPIERKRYKKGTTHNKVLKLSSNGVFGKTNDQYSSFFDPQAMYSVTVNGQLQLLQLVERIVTIPGLQLIQTNTDGITARMPRSLVWAFDFYKKEWEQETKLELEEVDYKSMWTRDCNNYVALKFDGSVKLKGAYWYPRSIDDMEGNWNKDYSMLVVQKLAEIMLVHGVNPDAMIAGFGDRFDFMKYYKAKGASVLMVGDKEVQKTTRYYVSTKGQPMKKIDPPRGPEGTYCRKAKLSDREFERILAATPPGEHNPEIHTKNKSVYKPVHTSIESGWLVKECNKASDFDWSDVDFKYYVEEVKKLQIGD